LLGDWKTFSLAYLLGDSMIGLRTADTLAAADFCAWYQMDRSKSRRKVHLVAVGQSGIVALHAAALHPDLFESITLRNTPRDWTSIVSDKYAKGQLDATIHAVLEIYDLPDLVKLAGQDKVKFE
jgi:pimeloyl-ACP methyl ester carboxylesterase